MSTELNITTALTLSKAQIGITSDVRDVYLTAIIKGVVQELETIQGIVLDLTNSVHLMYVVDLSVYRYENRNETALPINLYRRLNNLIINKDNSI